MYATKSVSLTSASEPPLLDPINDGMGVPIVHLRWKQRLGPVGIGARLDVPASTVNAVLVRCRINRLPHVDRATGEPIRRYEHD